MKKNNFYLLWGIIALITIGLSYIFIQIRKPLLILLLIAIVLVIYFLTRKKLTKEYMDERQMQVDMKSSSATMKVGSIVFILANVAIVIYAFGIPHMIMPGGPRAPPDHIGTPIMGNIALLEILLVILMFFVYVGFHAYYEHKYGGDIEDEE